MKKAYFLHPFRVFLGAALLWLLLPLSSLQAQHDFIYEAFREAWLHPEQFDEFVACNQGAFDEAYFEANQELKDYFDARYSTWAHRRALHPERFGWHSRSYLWYLENNPGAGTAIFLADIQRVAHGRCSWEETASGFAALWLKQKREAELDYFIKINERAFDYLSPKTVEAYILHQKQSTLEPLLYYLDMMAFYFREPLAANPIP